MRTSCLINHYNYGHFIGEAVESVLAQTHAVDEIVLVDDGSAPEHLKAVRAAAATSPNIHLIEKANGGQLSCFQTAIESSDGELVFFLDADDRWEPGYVERCLELFVQDPRIDFICTHDRKLAADGTLEGEVVPSRDLGYSVARCLERGGAWVGAPTSCLSMRRKILDRIFPVTDDSAYRICADEVLVYGASLAGARKYFLGEPLIQYRVHGENAFYGNKDNPERGYLRRLHGKSFVEQTRQRLGLPQSLMDIAHYEFRTLENATRKEYHGYRRLVMRSQLGLLSKFRICWGLATWYYLGRML